MRYKIIGWRWIYVEDYVILKFRIIEVLIKVEKCKEARYSIKSLSDGPAILLSLLLVNLFISSPSLLFFLERSSFLFLFLFIRHSREIVSQHISML